MEQMQRPSVHLDVSFFGADRRRDHRLDQSVVSMVLSEPSETCEASNKPKTMLRKKT